MRASKLKNFEIWTVENIKWILIFKSDYFQEIDLSFRSSLLLYKGDPYLILERYPTFYPTTLYPLFNHPLWRRKGYAVFPLWVVCPYVRLSVCPLQNFFSPTDHCICLKHTSRWAMQYDGIFIIPNGRQLPVI